MSPSRISTDELDACRQACQRDGVVHVPGLLTAAWTARLLGALQRARAVLATGATYTEHTNGRALIVLQGGKVQLERGSLGGRPVVPGAWIDAMVQPSAITPNSGYQTFIGSVRPG